MAHKRLSKEEKAEQQKRLLNQSLTGNRLTDLQAKQSSRGFQNFRAKQERYTASAGQRIAFDIETTGLGKMVYNPSELAWRTETEELTKNLDKMKKSEQIAVARKLQFYKYFEEVGLAQLYAHGGPFTRNSVPARALIHRMGPNYTGPRRTDVGPHGYVTFSDRHDAGMSTVLESLDRFITSKFGYTTGIIPRSLAAHKSGKAITEAEAIIGFMKGLQEADKSGQKTIKLVGHNVFYDIMGVQAFAIRNAEKLMEAGLDPFILARKYWSGDLQINAVEDTFFDVLRAKGIHQPAWARKYLVFGRASAGMFPDAPDVVPGMRMSKDVLLRDLERVRGGKQSFLRARPGWQLSTLFQTFFRYSHLTDEELGIPYSAWRKLDAHDAMWDTAFARAAHKRFSTLSENLELFGNLLSQKIVPPESFGARAFNYSDVETVAFARSGFAGRAFARPDIQNNEEYARWLMGDRQLFGQAKRRTQSIWKTWQWRTQNKINKALGIESKIPTEAPERLGKITKPVVSVINAIADRNLPPQPASRFKRNIYSMARRAQSFLNLPGWKKAGYGVAAAYGLYKAFDWAIMDRQDSSKLENNLPPNYVKGMQGAGYAVKVPWASPYQGPEQDEQTIELVKNKTNLLVLMGIYSASSLFPRAVAGLGGQQATEGLFKLTRNLEEMTPFRVGRIFGKSSKLSSFLTQEINVPINHLRGMGTRGLTVLGKAYANSLGMSDSQFLESLQGESALRLRRSRFSAFHELELGKQTYKLRMFQAGSRFGNIFISHGSDPSFMRQAVDDFAPSKEIWDLNLANQIYKRHGLNKQIWVPGYASTGSIASLARHGQFRQAAAALRRRIAAPIFGWHSTIWREVRVLAHERLRQVEHLGNSILRSPSIKKIAQKLNLRIPVLSIPKPSLAAETSVLKMYGKFAKVGIGLYAGWKAFDVINKSTGGALSNPLWNAYDRLRLARARISDAFGFTEIRKRHPEVSPAAGLAWAATPGIALLLAGSFRRMRKTPKFVNRQMHEWNKTENLDVELLSNNEVKRGSLLGERGATRSFGSHTPHRRERYNWFMSMSEKMSDREAAAVIDRPVAGAFARLQLRAGLKVPRKLNWKGKGLVGYVAGAVGLLAPFLLGTKETYEETQDILAGRKKIEVRKGRWWEAGCLTKDCQVMTEIGKSKSVKDIQIGENIINANGLLEEVTQVWVKPFSGKVYKFQTYINQVDETILTGNHIVPAIKLYTSKTFAHKNNLFIIKEFKADDINENCYVEVPKPKLPDEKIKQINVKNFLYKYIEKDNKIYPAQINHYTQKLVIAGKSTYCLNPVIEIDQDVSWLMGMFLAEGNLSFNNGNPTIIETVHHKNELEFANKIQRIVLDKFGIKVNIYQNNKSDNYIRLRICHSLLAQLFYGLFYKERTKNIPELIKYFSEENILAFIQGWFDGDGYKTRPEKAIKTSRLDYAKWLYDILLSLGYLPSINKSKSPKNGKVFTGYRVYWTNAKNIDRKGWLIVDDKLFAKIHSIETEDYEGNVYDLGLDNDPHLFVAGGFLVHNSTPWQGKNTSYFRYDQSARRRMDAERTLPGEGGGIISTIKDFVNPYWREKESYWTRPYPVSSPPFQDIPIVGPLLGSTIGRIFKPPAYMHRDTFEPSQGYIPFTRETEPSAQLGGLRGAQPHTQAGYRALLRDASYRTTEFIGLRGYLAQEWLMKPLTGGQAPYAEAPYLQAPRFNNLTDRFYRSELGGMLGQNEIFRRFFPRPEPGVEVNNIPNLMPNWIPGNDYFINFREGDPYSKIPYGSERLPGPGFEAIHPELKGIPYEKYPNWAKYEILSDISPWAKQTKIFEALARRDVENSQDAGLASYVDRITLEKQQVMNRRLFQPFSFLEKTDELRGTIAEISAGGDFKLEEYPYHTFKMKGVGFGVSQVSDYLRSHNRMTKEQGDEAAFRARNERINFLNKNLVGRQVDLTIHRHGLNAPNVPAEVELGGEPIGSYLGEHAMGADLQEGRVGAGFLQRTYGKFVEGLGHLPQHIPGPFFLQSKFHNQVSPIEGYRRDQLYSAEFRPWSTPYESFIRPYLHGAISKLTPGDFIPDHIQKNREMDVLHDRLAFLKAEQIGDTRGMGRTMAGADVMGNQLTLRSALPRRDREYFDAFLQETNPEAREKILGMVSQDMGRALVGQWSRQYNQTIGAQAQSTPMATRMEVASKLAHEEINNLGYNVPKQDWVGWHPEVDLEDIKAIHIDSEGMNVHNFNIWEDRMYNLNRKPYLHGSHEALTGQSLNLSAAILSHKSSYYDSNFNSFNEIQRVLPVSNITINHTQDHTQYEASEHYKARRAFME